MYHTIPYHYIHWLYTTVFVLPYHITLLLTTAVYVHTCTIPYHTTTYIDYIILRSLYYHTPSHYYWLLQSMYIRTCTIPYHTTTHTVATVVCMCSRQGTWEVFPTHWKYDPVLEVGEGLVALFTSILAHVVIRHLLVAVLVGARLHPVIVVGNTHIHRPQGWVHTPCTDSCPSWRRWWCSYSWSSLACLRGPGPALEPASGWEKLPAGLGRHKAGSKLWT